MIEEGGFTVWWDPARLPGEHYHDIIQSEIDAAGCMVVAWYARVLVPSGCVMKPRRERCVGTSQGNGDCGSPRVNGGNGMRELQDL
jgi:hypothetical protein